jgi:hypothetical protein
MKKTFISLLLALTLASAGCANSYGGGVMAQGRVSTGAYYGGGSLSSSYVYEDLGTYGYWIDYGPYGWSWTPYDVGPLWRPYTDGYWSYTEFGWTWVSYEPFGWAVYHYGRWIFDPAYGWIWVPDTEWAPAWVAWSYGDSWIGWAPLPPTVGWSVSVGLRWDGRDRIPSSHWCFVRDRDFADTRLSVKIVSVARNETLISRTRNVTRYEARQGRPVNLGLGVDAVERATGRRVHRANLRDVDSPSRVRSGSRGGTVEVFRPEIRPGSREAPPRRGRDLTDAIPPDERRSERADRMRRLERSLEQERERLERSQREEMRNRPRGASEAEIRERHRQEDEAFKRHAARQRQVVEERVKKNLVVHPGKGKRDSDDSRKGRKPERKGKGKGRPNGDG